jgi:hypothetical protein
MKKKGFYIYKTKHQYLATRRYGAGYTTSKVYDNIPEAIAWLDLLP